MRSFIPIGSIRCSKAIKESVVFPTCFFCRENHYGTLGVKKNATNEEIRNAYLAKTKQLHPDSNPNDDSLHHKFSEVNVAYSVLSNRTKKREYDLAYAVNRNNIKHQRNNAYTYQHGKYRTTEQDWWQQDNSYHEKSSSHWQSEEKHQIKSKNKWLLLKVFGSLAIFNVLMVLPIWNYRSNENTKNLYYEDIIDDEEPVMLTNYNLGRRVQYDRGRI